MSEISRMFSFAKPVNPLGGRCPYDCVYCWANSDRGLVKRFSMKKYQGEPYFDLRVRMPHVLKEEQKCVWLCTMLDMFAPNVPDKLIEMVLSVAQKNPEVPCMTLTKNPKRYFDFWDWWKKLPNMMLGATIETNWAGGFHVPSQYVNYFMISEAPHPVDRITHMHHLRGWLRKEILEVPLLVCVEPILDFDERFFAEDIGLIHPEAVAVGYDNYHWQLPEPALAKTEDLISELEKFTKVVRKSLRKAWWEK